MVRPGHTVIDTVAETAEAFPAQSRGILDPGLVRPRVTADGGFLLQGLRAGVVQTVGDRVQIVVAVDLHAEMIQSRCDTGVFADGEIDAGIVEQPPGVVAFALVRFGAEQGRIKTDRLFQIGNGNMYVQAFYGWVLVVVCEQQSAAVRSSPSRIAAWPWQQSSSR